MNTQIICYLILTCKVTKWSQTQVLNNHLNLVNSLSFKITHG